MGSRCSRSTLPVGGRSLAAGLTQVLTTRHSFNLDGLGRSVSVNIRGRWAIPLVMVVVQMSQPVSALTASMPAPLAVCEGNAPIDAPTLPNPVSVDVCDLETG